MRAYLDRTPITLKFEDNLENPELISKFNMNTFFKYKKPCKDYFQQITSYILNDKDPFEIIDDFYPEIEGYPKITIRLVTNDFENQQFEDSSFMVNVNEDIEYQVQEIANLLFRKAIANSKNKSIYFKINSIFNGNVELANAKFITKDYKGASNEFSKLTSTYSRRMHFLCKILDGYRKIDIDSIYDIDILIAYSLFDELFEIVFLLSDPLKLAIAFFLSKQHMIESKKMLSLFYCSKNLVIDSNDTRSNECLRRLKDIVIKLLEKENRKLNREFYSEMLELL